MTITSFRHLWLVAAVAAAPHASAQQRLEVGLDDLFALADGTSLQIRISETAHDVSAEGVKAARSRRRPDVNLSLSGSYIGTATVMSRGFSRKGSTTIPYATGVGEVSNGRQPTPHWGNDLVAQVTQVIYAGGALTAGIRMAEQGERVARLDVERNRQEVRFLLAGHYLELCKLSNQLEVVHRNIDLTERVLATMRARHAQGTVLRNDITRYELQLKSQQLRERQLQDAGQVINHELVTMLHLADSTLLQPRQPESTLTLGEAAAGLVVSRGEGDWQQLAAIANVSLQQASLTVGMSQQALRVARSATRPVVTLVAGNRLSGPYLNDFIPVDANVHAWYVGLGVSYDLGSLWRSHHEVKQARSRVQQSREQEELAREGVTHAVQAAYVTLQTSLVEVETQQKQAALADEHYQVTHNRYGHGLALLTDMLDASHTKLTADMELVNARISLLYNYYKLKYLTHTL